MIFFSIHLFQYLDRTLFKLACEPAKPDAPV